MEFYTNPLIYNLNIENERMKRDWKVIKELLKELEPLHQYNGLTLQVYHSGEHKSSETAIHKMDMAILLMQKNYITGMKSKTVGFGGFAEITNMNLTFEGHDLLDILEDKTLWKKIKNIAKDRGIEITFSTLPPLISKAISSLL